MLNLKTIWDWKRKAEKEKKREKQKLSYPSTYQNFNNYSVTIGISHSFSIYIKNKILQNGKLVFCNGQIHDLEIFSLFCSISVEAKLLLYDCNKIWIHNHLVCKQTLNHLAKLITSKIAPVSSKEFLDIHATIECRFTLKTHNWHDKNIQSSLTCLEKFHGTMRS